MNTTDAEIAGKIDGVTRGGVQAKKDSYNDTLWVTDGENYIHVESGSDYLDHCRAVVDEVDGPAKPTDIERIIYAKTPPTEPGKYYWKRCIDSVVWFVRDLIDMGRLGLGDHGELLESIGGLWGGRVPAPGTTWNVEQIAYYIENLQGKSHASAAQLLFNAVADITDPQSGIAATTVRHREGAGAKVEEKRSLSQQMRKDGWGLQEEQQ